MLPQHFPEAALQQRPLIFSQPGQDGEQPALEVCVFSLHGAVNESGNLIVTGYFNKHGPKAIS